MKGPHGAQEGKPVTALVNAKGPVITVATVLHGVQLTWGRGGIGGNCVNRRKVNGGCKSGEIAVRIQYFEGDVSSRVRGG